MNMKGSICKVAPLVTLEAIGSIERLLSNHPRNYALFVVGINTGFRASDLIAMTVGMFRGLKVGDSLSVREKKTGKVRTVTVNGAVISAVRPLLVGSESAVLFAGVDGGRLCVETINRLVKKWCHDADIPGNFGSHTLRKTWGYTQRVHFGLDIPTLMEAFGHATQKQTLTYLCIQPEEIRNAYLNEIRGI